MTSTTRPTGEQGAERVDMSSVMGVSGPVVASEFDVP